MMFIISFCIIMFVLLNLIKLFLGWVFRVSEVVSNIKSLLVEVKKGNELLAKLNTTNQVENE